MKSFLVIIFLSMSFITHAQNPHNKYDSASSAEFKMAINAGLIFTENPENVLVEIKEQTKYLFGVFLDKEAGYDWVNQRVTLGKETLLETGLYQVEYKLESYISLPENYYYELNLKVPLPVRADQEGLQYFVDLYEKNCSFKVTGPLYFWDYFRPSLSSCQLRNLNEPHSGVVATNLSLVPSERKTKDKKPEYKKIWEDGLLEMSFIITKNHSNDTEGYGISDFNELYQGIIELFGRPQEINATFEGSPGIKNPELHLLFFKDNKKIKIHLFLISNMNENPADLMMKFNQYLSISDYISYNGHSGLGINVNNIINGLEFIKDKYQVLFLNSCATYGHLSDALFKRREEINSNESGTKYLDVIVNSSRNFFGTFAGGNLGIIKSLISAKESYKELLLSLDSYQHAIVLGEEDNE